MYDVFEKYVLIKALWKGEKIIIINNKNIRGLLHKTLTGEKLRLF